MRLGKEQAATIRQLVKNRLGEESQVWLFGSRVDDSKRGGDLDLYVESKQPCDLSIKLSLMSEIQRSIGLRKVDLLVKNEGDPEREVFVTAKSEGVCL